MDFVGDRDGIAGIGTDSKAEEAIKRAEEAEKKLLAYMEKENADLLKRAEEAEKKLKKEKKKNSNLKSYLQKKDDALHVGSISKYICGFDNLKKVLDDDNTVATYDTRTTYETHGTDNTRTTYGTYGTYGTNDTRTTYGGLGFTGCCGAKEFDVITTAGTYDTSGTYETFDTRGAYGEHGSRYKDDKRDESEEGGGLPDDDVTVVAANKSTRSNVEAGSKVSEVMVVPPTEYMGDVEKTISWAIIDAPDEVSLDTEVTEEDYYKTMDLKSRGTNSRFNATDVTVASF
eukprot:CAMPEP_0181024270 /NCGR_PEP_ID=MMETSP1070-20121207/2483_1 /TAXON_ID=265543 /ORGANISM="Minutocellus polymorphus, Strain NH13" /LENGTH=286 /DNA_ID=CAMNT_0023101317 /DNA_START=224 /DNA_END=1084 /DNA_ORIENTATION=+